MPAAERHLPLLLLPSLLLISCLDGEARAAEEGGGLRASAPGDKGDPLRASAPAAGRCPRVLVFVLVYSSL